VLEARPPTTLTERIEAELDFIATAQKDLALAFVRVLYEEAAAQPEDEHAPLRAKLMEHPRFRWLLWTLAYSSIVVFKVGESPVPAES
jgi:hypothetical protein